MYHAFTGLFIFVSQLVVLGRVMDSLSVEGLYVIMVVSNIFSYTYKMLTINQKGYLATVPLTKIARIVPFDPATQSTAREIIAEVKALYAAAETYYIGSSKLGIAGENDIDLSVFVGNGFLACAELFEKKYGAPVHKNLDKKQVGWEFVRNTFPVELHLSDVIDDNFQEQLDTQKVLEENEAMRAEYEELKLQCDGMVWREYLRRKYEFWNRVLGLDETYLS
jgi:GrpB-like predicted nucleotidyltransferase (UPF0157 family)